MEVKTFMNHHSSSEENKGFDANASQSIAQSISTCGKDYYSNVKKRIKNNIKFQKSALLKIKWFFIIGLVLFSMASLVNSYFVVNQSSYVFSQTYFSFIFHLQSVFGRLFGMGYLANYFNLAKFNPSIFGANYTKSLSFCAYVNQTEKDFESNLLNYTQSISKTIDESDQNLFNLFRIPVQYDFGKNLTLNLKIANFFRVVFLNSTHSNLHGADLINFSSILNLNFKSNYEKVLNFFDLISSDFDSGFNFLQLFEICSLIVAFVKKNNPFCAV